MLGELIAQLDTPEVCANVLMTCDPLILQQIERRATAASMTVVGFVAGAVREFVERGDDDLWFQLLTVMRKSEEPGIVAVQTILRWVVVEQESRS